MIYLRHIITLLFLVFIFSACRGQHQEININTDDISKALNILASDEMRGRNALSKPDIERAGEFIENEFKKANLSFLGNATSYKQPFVYTRDAISYDLNNIVGILPGKSKEDEFVIFSAHYDHIGIIPTLSKDSIANGADDNASGATAIIQLAKYFAKKSDNERTLIFVAFNAEEIGGYGSQFFAKQFDSNKIIAMVNLEMIGKHSKFGKNNAFITGYQYSNFGKILKKNLKDSDFKFYPDPYPKENLFYRSDNASLAKLGVPAHTISSAQIDNDKLYHTVEDEIETLDVENIASIIKAIIISTSTIISGKDTPTRIINQ